ncbi:hypothetical protein [Nocardioides sp. CFH 31398]|uniref:hypothetical protein n=1 Tax=Nocardioides sp. CFH 31398 TaxID=2919579 RepID=UPI001F06AC33|nr:hypothetical protein [Nocardioides sp. CFH 31398]MCH1868711.1 hypothetical protein [Nocardioides sp. CFH 31398]
MNQQENVQPTGWDHVVGRLQEARHAAGDPSYAEVAQRVTTVRVGRGDLPDGARVARSTVYDCFRPGRSRIDAPLLRDIGLSLGVDAAEVDRWIAERDAPPPEPEPGAEPVPHEPPVATAQAGLTPVLVALLLLGGVLANLVGIQLQVALALPLYLDMLGTAVVAVALGPWRAVAVGLATNLLGAAVFGWASIPFALVNVVGALVWGYGVHRWGLGRTLPRFLGLNLLAALACSAVALLVIAVLFGPDADASGSQLLGGLLTDAPAWVAMVVSNLVTSAGDKLLSGFLALAAVGLLPLAVRTALNDRLVGVEPATTS